MLMWGGLLAALAMWVGRYKPPAPELAYMSDQDGDWDIYALDMGSNIHARMTIDPPTAELTLDFIDNRYPAWSPDGQWLAYHADIYGNWDLFLMDEKGDIVRQLTDDPMDEAMPAWSPDGRRIAFHSTRAGNWDIYVITIATGEVQRVTFYAGEDTFAVWSPDGRQMAYVSDRDGDQEIYIRTAQETEGPEALDNYTLRQVTENGVDDWSPVWSPDGQYLAYVSENPTAGYGIYVVSAALDTEPIPLDSGVMSTEWNPTWVQTANGLALIFVSNLNGNDAIYMINMDDFTLGYSDANLVSRGLESFDGFVDSRWAPDWRPMP